MNILFSKMQGNVVTFFFWQTAYKKRSFSILESDHFFLSIQVGKPKSASSLVQQKVNIANLFIGIIANVGM